MDRTRFASDKQYVQRTAREKLGIIIANSRYLMKVRKGYEMLKAARDMSQQTGELSPNQVSYIDGILEKVYSGAGFESCSVKSDRKRKY